MRLSALADIRSGSLHDRSEADALYVLAGDIAQGGLRTSRLATGARPTKSDSVAALSVGDVVIALRGNVNSAAMVPDLTHLDRPVFATLDVAVIRTGPTLSASYLAWFLNLPTTQDVLATDRSGSAAPRLPLSALKELDVPLPAIARQRLIASVADSASREAWLIAQIKEARQRVLNELLRQAAEEGSAPGECPARTDHHPQRRGATMRAFSNPEEWNP